MIGLVLSKKIIFTPKKKLEMTIQTFFDAIKKFITPKRQISGYNFSGGLKKSFFGDIIFAGRPKYDFSGYNISGAAKKSFFGSLKLLIPVKKLFSGQTLSRSQIQSLRLSN
jgi:hypothetical protein